MFFAVLTAKTRSLDFRVGLKGRCRQHQRVGVGIHQRAAAAAAAATSAVVTCCCGCYCCLFVCIRKHKGLVFFNSSVGGWSWGEGGSNYFGVLQEGDDVIMRGGQIISRFFMKTTTPPLQSY